MTAVLICAAEPRERVRLANTFRDLAARLSDDEWGIASAAGLGDADQRLRNASLVDLVCCDVSEDGALDWLQRLRAAYPEALLMLVTAYLIIILPISAVFSVLERRLRRAGN